MRCRFHPCDPGRVGVCASCLRERLEALVAERERRKPVSASSLVSAARQSSVTASSVATSCPDFPLSFPRSVSPYVSARDRESLFFSTPQLNPSKKNHHQDVNHSPVPRKEKRFSLFSAIFGRRKPSETPPAVSSSSSPPSSSWLSSILPIRHKKSRLFPAAAAGSRNSCRRRDCGMSPAAPARGRDDEVPADEAGYVPDARGSRLKPDASAIATAAATRRTLQQHNPSGFAICLSPLMRPSPNHRHQEQVVWDLPAYAGDFRVSNSDKYVSAGPSAFCSRSRKLSDLGKFP
ncbi:uncharacterized protein LOC116253728 [Nymphaea colorata]|uniref:uncharacterized protein LOC116253728 n=1 Tax=Nymphaea colorata TaxID=210225 RepID=UPI00129ED117|nr:uncharacterized protein LOC116253728 [Nymphaea colorata]